mmetsp:Transcript_15793/g.28468  ORF Transcript_15793/g.28468 Transcript_15793/m.28468 type:complete len:219 (+) Transcript_15793:594-1250(+)
MRELLLCEHALEFGNFVHAHGEDISPHPHDRVEEEDPRRVSAEVPPRILVAEGKVVQKRTVRVLHFKVALVVHELHQALVVLWRWRQLRIQGLHELHLLASPVQVDAQLGLLYHPWQHPLHCAKDRQVQIEVRVGTNDHRPVVVLGYACRNHSLALDVVIYVIIVSDRLIFPFDPLAWPLARGRREQVVRPYRKCASNSGVRSRDVATHLSCRGKIHT